MDVVGEQLAQSEYVEESRKIAIERVMKSMTAPAWDGRGFEQMSDPALGL
jgi:hypothetical protein